MKKPVAKADTVDVVCIVDRLPALGIIRDQKASVDAVLAAQYEKNGWVKRG